MIVHWYMYTCRCTWRAFGHGVIHVHVCVCMACILTHNIIFIIWYCTCTCTRVPTCGRAIHFLWFKLYSHAHIHVLYSLLLYGMLCCLDERYPEAGEFFELATATDPNSVIAWTIRGKHNNYHCNKENSQYICT